MQPPGGSALEFRMYVEKCSTEEEVRNVFIQVVIILLLVQMMFFLFFYVLLKGFIWASWWADRNVDRCIFSGEIWMKELLTSHLVEKILFVLINFPVRFYTVDSRRRCCGQLWNSFIIKYKNKLSAWFFTASKWKELSNFVIESFVHESCDRVEVKCLLAPYADSCFSLVLEKWTEDEMKWLQMDVSCRVLCFILRFWFFFQFFYSSC